jgi:hypothetical protein
LNDKPREKNLLEERARDFEQWRRISTRTHGAEPQRIIPVSSLVAGYEQEFDIDSV